MAALLPRPPRSGPQQPRSANPPSRGRGGRGPEHVQEFLPAPAARRVRPGRPRCALETVTITLRKARTAVKRQGREMHDVGREQTIADHDEPRSAYWAL